MWILYGEYEMHVPCVRSLKEKRMIVSSMKDIIPSRFDVILKECAHHDAHRTLTLCAVSLSNDKDYLYSLWDQIVVFSEERYDVRVIRDEVSVFQGEV